MEPERPIEKLLRAFAKKRGEQAGAPLELDPVARRRLHDEIARQANQPRRENFFLTLFAAVRPKLAFAVCVIGVVCVGAFLLLPLFNGAKSRGLGQVTFKRERLSGAERDELPAATPAAEGSNAKKLTPPNELSDRAAENRPHRELDLQIASTQDKPQPPQPVASVPTPATLARRADEKEISALSSNYDSVKTKSVTVNDGSFAVVPGAPVAEPSKAREFAGGGGGGGGDAGGGQVRFYRLPEAATETITGSLEEFKRAAVSNQTLLASFVVEQNGKELRIVDQDGSVYSGHVELEKSPASVAAPATSPVPARTPTPATPKSAPVANTGTLSVSQDGRERWSFVVSGTNLSLGQKVVFSGTLLPGTNGIAAATARSGGVAADASTASILPRLQFQNCRIDGTALIENTGKVEIRAAPARGF